LFVIGSTGTGKTTYTSLLTQLFNRDKELRALTRVNSTCAAMEALLSENADCTVVLDDLAQKKENQLLKN